MPSTPQDPWSEFRLDTAEGQGLVRPRLHVEFFVEYPKPETVLGFYRHVLQQLDDRLHYFETGSGRYRKRNAKSQLLVETWCRVPTLWPKYVYHLSMQDAEIGIGDAELLINYAARERTFTGPVWFDKLLSGIRPPLYYSHLSVSLPVDHPLVVDNRVAEWVAQSPAMQDESLISVTAGWAIDVPLNPPLSIQGPAARERGGALLQRYPGLTCVSHMPIGTKLLKWDLAYAQAHGDAVPRPYVKRADWLTILTAAQVELLGGLDFLREQLGRTPGITISRQGHGYLIRAGDRPQLGDLAAGHVPAEYLAVSRAIRPLCLPMGDFRPELGNAFREHGFRAWYDALAKA